MSLEVYSESYHVGSTRDNLVLQVILLVSGVLIMMLL